MLDNHIYDLMSQLVEESQSLYRLKNEYKENAEHCEKCAQLFSSLENIKEENIRQLQERVKHHLTS